MAKTDKQAALPATAEEMHALGWDRPDIILVTGDAYVDHPAFGVAMIGRYLQSLGYRVAILPQPAPDCHGRNAQLDGLY